MSRSQTVELSFRKGTGSESGLPKRAFDGLVGVALLLLFSPVLIACSLVAASGGQLLGRSLRVGQRGMTFEQLSFDLPDNLLGRFLRRLHSDKLPLLLNIIRGDLSLVGPRALSPDELDVRDPRVQERHRVKPGLVCLWWIRRRANIDYGDELDVDIEYVRGQTLRRDLTIALRALVVSLYGDGLTTSYRRQVKILGVSVDNVTMGDALSYLHRRLGSGRPSRVAFVNADCLNLAQRHRSYRDALEAADLVLPDGIGVKIAAKVLGVPIKQNVNGTDLFPRLCEMLQHTGEAIYLLGGKPGVAEKVRDRIEATYPSLRVAGFHHGFFPAPEEQSVVASISSSGASVLLVAMGAPAQDLWIQRQLEHTGAKLALGVGGLFDFYSCRIPRAPQWVRELGMEWLYRFAQEPRRLWRRYFVGNGLFLCRVFAEKAFGSIPTACSTEGRGDIR